MQHFQLAFQLDPRTAGAGLNRRFARASRLGKARGDKAQLQQAGTQQHRPQAETLAAGTHCALKHDIPLIIKRKDHPPQLPTPLITVLVENAFSESRLNIFIDAVLFLLASAYKYFVACVQFCTGQALVQAAGDEYSENLLKIEEQTIHKKQAMAILPKCNG
ncbi:hypothetical protein [Vogesella alkaliphila]|uniref:hypothetical protein n=1 Tax=Vogesella alkaliphila TaxID=1193621 RepID=UPI001E2B453B|nr:hypothetical protein [Vogesella alkaliphila]